MSEIKIYKKEDFEPMRNACQLAKRVLDYIEPYIQENTTTEKLDTLCHDFIIANNATSATLNYKGFPKSICTSVNHVVCHGIPGSYKLVKGDIINIDVTVNLNGWFGDTSRTFIVGPTTKLAENLVKVTQEALYIGINAVKPGGYFEDIGKAIQEFVDKYGYSIVKDYCGHGIGRVYHDEPIVIHYDSGEQRQRILPGMFFTIEPMINAGSHKIKILKDGWTAVTIDKSLSAQFEHTIGVIDNTVEILTA
ncbi:MAG: type I methionyl aminopeptidase [Holosporales bacterium]|jgi:methionyl aminopeptidase|nr:type I methionyl aminopeptidase [Holosporales bacterium]